MNHVYLWFLASTLILIAQSWIHKCTNQFRVVKCVLWNRSPELALPTLLATFWIFWLIVLFGQKDLVKRWFTSLKSLYLTRLSCPSHSCKSSSVGMITAATVSIFPLFEQKNIADKLNSVYGVSDTGNKVTFCQWFHGIVPYIMLLELIYFKSVAYSTAGKHHALSV